MAEMARAGGGGAGWMEGVAGAGASRDPFIEAANPARRRDTNMTQPIRDVPQFMIGFPFA